MTNEEAIKWIENHFDPYINDGTKQSLVMQMAITALKNYDPTMDIRQRLENAIIYGYAVNGLILFADACRRKGITNDQLKDFCTNIENAYTYMTEQMKTILNKQFGLKGIEHD